MSPETLHLVDLAFGGCFLAVVIFGGGLSIGYAWGHDKATAKARKRIEDAAKKYNVANFSDKEWKK